MWIFLFVSRQSFLQRNSQKMDLLSLKALPIGILPADELVAEHNVLVADAVHAALVGLTLRAGGGAFHGNRVGAVHRVDGRPAGERIPGLLHQALGEVKRPD
jgi:hypothetical protein